MGIPINCCCCCYLWLGVWGEGGGREYLFGPAFPPRKLAVLYLPLQSPPLRSRLAWQAFKGLGFYMSVPFEHLPHKLLPRDFWTLILNLPLLLVVRLLMPWKIWMKFTRTFETLCWNWKSNLQRLHWKGFGQMKIEVSLLINWERNALFSRLQAISRVIMNCRSRSKNQRGKLNDVE